MVKQKSLILQKKLILWMVAFILFAGLVACQTPAGRSAGAVVDDSTITTKVKAKLLADDTLSGFAISVETFQGEVTLTGAVKNQDQQTAAEQIAKSVPGVRDVNNLLKIM
jgi:hyperosmotically inducible periplasmic protein